MFFVKPDERNKLVVAMPCNEEGDEEERSVFIRAAKSASGIPYIL